MIHPDKLLTRAEVANWLDVTRQYLDAIGSRGDAPPFLRIGRAIRYDRHAVMAWLQRHAAPPLAAN
jgi:predicted DNA-binding transcriptional regulator AlpA